MSSSDLMALLGAGGEETGIYRLALTHRSHAFEQEGDPEHNERLEFLGDAVLEAFVTERIYLAYPDMNEGEMARLRASVVNTQALAAIAREIDLGARLRLGKGEEASGGRDKDSILANAFEAVVGAIFLYQGFRPTTLVLEPLFAERLEASASATRRYDAKTALQELVVRRTGGASPSYRITSSGPDHDKRFTADVFIEGEALGTGSGRSKKEAEYNAAQQALDVLEERSPETEGSHARAG